MAMIYVLLNYSYYSLNHLHSGYVVLFTGTQKYEHHYFYTLVHVLSKACIQHAY